MAIISTKNIAKTIYEMTKDQSGNALDDTLKKITEYLKTKRLLAKTPEILEKLQEIINKENNTVMAKMTFRTLPSRHELESIVDHLKKRYQAKTIVTKVLEDKNILGGVKIEARDELIDLTLRNKINQLHKYLIAN